MWFSGCVRNLNVMARRSFEGMDFLMNLVSFLEIRGVSNKIRWSNVSSDRGFPIGDENMHRGWGRAGIYPSPLTNVCLFWRRLSFVREKVIGGKAIIFVAWGWGQNHGELSGGKVINIFGFLMTLRWLNGLKWHLKNYIYNLR